mgnify:CR=1 FL=1
MTIHEDIYNYCDELADDFDCIFNYNKSGYNKSAKMYFLYFDYVTQVRDERTWEEEFEMAFPEVDYAEAVYEGGSHEREMWVQVYL